MTEQEVVTVLWPQDIHFSGRLDGWELEFRSVSLEALADGSYWVSTALPSEAEGGLTDEGIQEVGLLMLCDLPASRLSGGAISEMSCLGQNRKIEFRWRPDARHLSSSSHTLLAAVRMVYSFLLMWTDRQHLNEQFVRFQVCRNGQPNPNATHALLATIQKESLREACLPLAEAA